MAKYVTIMDIARELGISKSTVSRALSGYTCVNLPYGTLCGAMTQDIDERAKLNTSRSVSAMMAGSRRYIPAPGCSRLLPYR